jgi:hypothetical protein
MTEGRSAFKVLIEKPTGMRLLEGLGIDWETTVEILYINSWNRINWAGNRNFQ